MSTVITRTDTPETDECTLLAIDIDFGGNFEAVHAQVSRNLERQRNESRELVRELRDALKDLYGWARDWDSPFMEDEQFDKSKYLDKITKANQLLP